MHNKKHIHSRTILYKDNIEKGIESDTMLNARHHIKIILTL